MTHTVGTCNIKEIVQSVGKSSALTACILRARNYWFYVQISGIILLMARSSPAKLLIRA